MSIPGSQFMSPPNPLATINLFSTSVTLFLLLKIGSFVPLFLDSTHKQYRVILVSVWLISLSMIISRSIYIAANGMISFPWLSNIPLCIYVCVNHTFFIHSSISFQIFTCHLSSRYVTLLLPDGSREEGSSEWLWLMFMFTSVEREDFLNVSLQLGGWRVSLSHASRAAWSLGAGDTVTELKTTS